ncbi:hypothetical protein [Eilatimonas milleporae]|nr:hypothetical protein [Eilatimonas milleporae]
MTAVVLGWGAVEDPQVAEACDRGFGMDRVRARTNLGYDLISVITLGFVRPLDLSYRCYTGESPVGSTRD